VIALASRLSALALLAATLSAPTPAEQPAVPGVFVLGVDGMDPVILQRLMDEGKMPEFSRLAAEGTFQSLGTINPPQSPVAWSSFATGMDPGGHGIFDFIHRDPKTYMPIPSGTPPAEEDPAYVELFGYVIPLGGEEPANARSGTPFWDILDEAGVPTEVYRIPGNYPVPASDAITLSGMGTVDMRGEFGKFTWYTDDAFMSTAGLKADVEIVSVDDEDLDGVPDTVRSKLKGPPDIMHLPPGKIPGPDEYLVVPLTVHVDPEEDVVWIKAGDAECILREGEFSEWLQVGFDALPMGMLNLAGTVRFYAKEVRPNFRLYASPVNIDPSAPAQPVATPDGAAEELAEAIGLYATQGFPEEINALKDGLFSDDDYIAQVAVVHEEAERMLDEVLNRFEPGDCSFMYLSDIDLQCHMLWRHGDPKHLDAPRHPGFEDGVSPKHDLDVEGFYRQVDRTLGHVRSRLPQGTLLMVMSDHGFQAQTRQAHLNAWLVQEGYLVLKEGLTTGAIPPPMDPDTHEFLVDEGDVDWSRTRAYGLGFNGLYLNLQGREVQGIVPADQAEALMDELARKLTAWRDPVGGAQIVLNVRRKDDIYAEARRDEAPDLIVGYDAGYGCSEASTLGGITENLIEDNTRGFTGNHLMAPEVVPGVLLLNRKLDTSGHDLTDLTATLLDHFGLPPGEGMTGRSIFKD
jgi:predicted AlkP superfamily phosphohydrolase/phosphomutase